MAAGESNSTGMAAADAPILTPSTTEVPSSATGGRPILSDRHGSTGLGVEGAGGDGLAAADATYGTPDNPAVSDAEGAGDAVIKTIFDQLLDELPEGLNEDEVFARDGFYSKITPDHIAELPPVAKQIVHNLRRDYTQKRQRDADAARQVTAELAQERHALASREKDLMARQAALTKIARSGEFLKKANLSDDALPHPDSPEGLQARAERAAAQAVSEYLLPVEKELEAQRRHGALVDFETSHPRMKEPAFRAAVIDRIKSRKSAGFSISTPDAYHLVNGEYDRAAADKAEANDRVRERRARAVGARQVGKSSGAAGQAKGIPKFANARDAYEWAKANKVTTDQLRRMNS